MRLFSTAVIAAFALLPLACTAASDDPFKLDTHYKTVRVPQPPETAGRISVEEAFWYGCPHCYSFDPYVESWLKKKPPNVDFVRIPATLGHEANLIHSKAYYAAQTMGVGDLTHKPLFKAIHENKQPMNTMKTLVPFLATAGGFSAEEFSGAMDSFIVDGEVRRAENRLRDYGVSSVPMVVVGGRYYTNGTLAGGFDRVFKVVDFLIEKVRRERAGK